MEPIVSENVMINGCRISYGIHGTGHPVVLLHGALSSSLIWRNVLPHLTENGYMVHVYDLLGYGLSERPSNPSIDTSTSAQVPILEALLSHWGLETFHLVAHSIGGVIAQRFGVFYPRRLRSLILIDALSFDSFHFQGTKEEMEKKAEQMIKAKDDDHRAHFRTWLLSAVYNKQKFEESSLETFLDYISGPIGQGSLVQHQLRHHVPKHAMEIADRLHKLMSVPVKIVWGEHDAWQTVEWADKLNEAIPASYLEFIVGCGHFAPEDQPEPVADSLIEFFDKWQK